MVRLYLIHNDCLRRPGVQTHHCEEWRPLQHSRSGHTVPTSRHTTLATVSSRDHIRLKTRESAVIPDIRGSALSAVATSRNSSCAARTAMRHGSSA